MDFVLALLREGSIVPRSGTPRNEHRNDVACSGASHTCHSERPHSGALFDKHRNDVTPTGAS